MNPNVNPLRRMNTIARIARLPLTIAAAVVLLAGCGADRGEKKAQPHDTATADPAAGTYVLGSSVTGEGAIADGTDTEAFVRGGPIFLSIDVAGATTDQTIEIDWIGPRGRIFRHDRRLVRQGARYVAFAADSTARWVPGTYRVIIMIDGRRVNEQSFSVIGNTAST